MHSVFVTLHVRIDYRQTGGTNSRAKACRHIVAKLLNLGIQFLGYRGHMLLVAVTGIGLSTSHWTLKLNQWLDRRMLVI